MTLKIPMATTLGLVFKNMDYPSPNANWHLPPISHKAGAKRLAEQQAARALLARMELKND